MAQMHDYPVSVRWSGGKDGGGSASCGNTGTQFPLSIGKEFGGPGAGTNPEELLTSSIAACWAITFGLIAANRKLPVANIEANAVGHVEQNGMQFTFTKITLRPKITLEPGATDEQAALASDMAHKAESYCIITAAVRDKVAVELEVEVVRT
ncbi:MAG: OsmC family protein [Armatimonadetes bacterium]|nr:OsmC family protein [Armatimonadota bacterium]